MYFEDAIPSVGSVDARQNTKPYGKQVGTVASYVTGTDTYIRSSATGHIQRVVQYVQRVGRPTDIQRVVQYVQTVGRPTDIQRVVQYVQTVGRPTDIQRVVQYVQRVGRPTDIQI